MEWNGIARPKNVFLFLLPSLFFLSFSISVFFNCNIPVKIMSSGAITKATVVHGEQWNITVSLCTLFIEDSWQMNSFFVDVKCSKSIHHTFLVIFILVRFHCTANFYGINWYSLMIYNYWIYSLEWHYENLRENFTLSLLSFLSSNGQNRVLSKDPVHSHSPKKHRFVFFVYQ